jgi:chemotaxis protein MotA
MDIATIAGLLLAFGALMVAVLIEGGKLGGFFNVSAGIIVLGGTLGAMVVCYPFKTILGMPGVLKQAFFAMEIDPLGMMKTVIQFARKARREGILVLEEDAKRLNNEFLKTGIQLVVDGTPGELVREILETQVRSMEQRHQTGEGMFSTLGGFAPTLGILGTVMGLVHMLASLDEPGKMGPAIAAAFIATLYGVGTANLIFLPIASKLKARSQAESLAYELAIEGILSLQAGDNPRVVASKMASFLPPKLRAQFEQETAGGVGEG